MAQNDGMLSLIGVVNQLHDASTQLRDAFPQYQASLGLELPQIAVVGSQSAGKSSVLENFVGRDFLPRGAGIVTRRPLVLQLIHSRQEEYAEFLHLKGHKFTDFDQVCTEIQRETDRVTGSNKGISPIPINLRVYSPNVLDLTLVDLPGMTRVPIGDQPADIEMQIRDMILTYISSENCLILAVSAANTDLANSDALKLAKEVDPAGVRTIGVLTKLDLMDQGTDAKEILDNRLCPLRYGYIGIVNRSQRDIDSRKRIEDAVEKERRFFLQHPVYKSMIDQLGTQYLQRMLNAHLTRHIAETLPGLRSQLMNQMVKLEKDISAFRFEFDYDDPTWKPKALVIQVIRFAERYRQELLGNNDINLSYDAFSFGAQIRHIFHVKYPLLLTSVEFTDETMMKREIGFAIQNIIGIRVGIFTPDKAFDHIIRTQIHKMKKPTMEVLDLVAERLLSSLTKNLEESQRFPALAREMESLTRVALLNSLEKCRTEVQTLLDLELAYINAKHEDFVGFSVSDIERKKGGSLQVRKKPESVQIHCGWLAVTNVGLLKSSKFWFVLTCESLSWYRDDTLTDRKYSIPVDETIKFVDPNKGNRLILANRRGQNVFRDLPQLELQARTLEDLEEWKVSFVNVGIFPLAIDTTNTDDEDKDPHLKWQIETIWVLVASYLGIVRRNLQDMVPKAIAHTLIKGSVAYFEQKLVAEFSQSRRCDELMEENRSEVEKLQRLRRTLECCKQALRLIDEVKLAKPHEFQGATSAPVTVAPKHSRPRAPVSTAPPTPMRPVPPPKPPPVQEPSMSIDKPFQRTSIRKSQTSPGLSRKSSQHDDVKKALKQIDSTQRSMFYSK